MNPRPPRPFIGLALCIFLAACGDRTIVGGKPGAPRSSIAETPVSFTAPTNLDTYVSAVSWDNRFVLVVHDTDYASVYRLDMTKGPSLISLAKVSHHTPSHHTTLRNGGFSKNGKWLVTNDGFDVKVWSTDKFRLVSTRSWGDLFSTEMEQVNSIQPGPGPNQFAVIGDLYGEAILDVDSSGSLALKKLRRAGAPSGGEVLGCAAEDGSPAMVIVRDETVVKLVSADYKTTQVDGYGVAGWVGGDETIGLITRSGEILRKAVTASSLTKTHDLIGMTSGLAFDAKSKAAVVCDSTTVNLIDTSSGMVVYSKSYSSGTTAQSLNGVLGCLVMHDTGKAFLLK